MSRFGRYLLKTQDGYMHWCPGCAEAHYIAVETPLAANGARWTFDGNAEAPTFNPSVHITVPGDQRERILPERCHYFLRGGKIQFCADSTHELAGKTVDLPPWPEGDDS